MLDRWKTHFILMQNTTQVSLRLPDYPVNPLKLDSIVHYAEYRASMYTKFIDFKRVSIEIVFWSHYGIEALVVWFQGLIAVVSEQTTAKSTFNGPFGTRFLDFKRGFITPNNMIPQRNEVKHGTTKTGEVKFNRSKQSSASIQHVRCEEGVCTWNHRLALYNKCVSTGRNGCLKIFITSAFPTDELEFSQGWQPSRNNFISQEMGTFSLYSIQKRHKVVILHCMIIFSLSNVSLYPGYYLPHMSFSLAYFSCSPFLKI